VEWVELVAADAASVEAAFVELTLVACDAIDAILRRMALVWGILL